MYFLGKNKEVLDAELWAIADALEMVRKKAVNDHVAPITVFSDLQEALASIRQSISHTGSPYLRDLVYQRTLAFKKKGHPVTFRWIPSHLRLLGHEKADKGAKDKAHKEGKPVEHWSSLAHVRKNLLNRTLKNLLDDMSWR